MSVNLTVCPVARHDVVAIWPRVLPWLEPPFKQFPAEYTLDQLKVLLVSGEQTLLVALRDDAAVEGAATVATHLYPNETVAFITSVGGAMVSNAGVFSQLQAICRAQGYTCIRGAVRESVARLYRRLGFQETQRLIEVKI